MNTRFRVTTLALAAAAFAVACADPATGPSRTLVPDGVDKAVTQNVINFPGGGWYPPGVDDGRIILCKTGDFAGTFNFAVSVNNGAPFNVTRTLANAGATDCGTGPIYTALVGGNSFPETVVITEEAQANWAVTNIDIVQHLAIGILNAGNYTAPRLNDAFSVANRQATTYINKDMARTVTFTNDYTAPPPPPAICDFITFGRIVLEVNNKKVVISGNAGGNNMDASIKNEFHIEANGVDNHVADAFSYGPITSGPLFGLTNSRIVTGTAKNGVAVELRLWDGGEPGKGTDKVYVKLNGVELLGANGQFINLGNMQYHSTCRGPG